MQLTDRVHLVAGGSWGASGLSPNPDCHVYLIDGGGPLALVDAGSGVDGSQEAILDGIQGAGFAVEAIEAILVTHMHGDHIGGAPALAGLTGAPVYGSKTTVDVLATGDEKTSCVGVAREAGIYPPDYQLASSQAGQVVSDGESLQVGDLSVVVVGTPGHCAGHVSFLLEHRTRRDLFSGDALFWRGRVLVQAIPDCDPFAMAESIRQLAQVKHFDGLFPGHGAFVVRGGSQHVATAAERVATLRMPPEL